MHPTASTYTTKCDAEIIHSLSSNLCLIPVDAFVIYVLDTNGKETQLIFVLPDRFVYNISTLCII